MTAMESFRNDASVVLGPCPGCLAWQIDYTDEVAMEWVEWRIEEVHEFGSEDPVDTFPIADPSAFHEVIEDALMDHLIECVHLQRYVFAS